MTCCNSLTLHSVDHSGSEQHSNAVCVHSSKPRVEIRQVLELCFDRQAEEIALVKTAAISRSAFALPHITIDGVERVIHENFFAGGEIAFCEYESLPLSGIYIAIRIAGMIDEAFRRLHEDHGSVWKKIAMALQLAGSGPKWMFRINYARVIQMQEHPAAPKCPCYEDALPLNGRREHGNQWRLQTIHCHFLASIQFDCRTANVASCHYNGLCANSLDFPAIRQAESR